jgi:hypothetical protein
MIRLLPAFLLLSAGCSAGILSGGTSPPDGAVVAPDRSIAPDRLVALDAFVAHPDSYPVPMAAPDGPNPNGPNPDGPTTNIDTVKADALASTAKQGQAGGSLGRCWEYVWKAMIKAGVATEQGGDKLGQAGPCSLGQFNASAYCFGSNAAANPGLLYQTFRMQQLSTSPASAPRGAVIVWDRGCKGYSSTHGHIEVSQGDGTACSDFCGSIAGGAASCSWVFAPVL